MPQAVLDTHTAADIANLSRTAREKTKIAKALAGKRQVESHKVIEKLRLYPEKDVEKILMHPIPESRTWTISFGVVMDRALDKAAINLKQDVPSIVKTAVGEWLKKKKYM